MSHESLLYEPTLRLGELSDAEREDHYDKQDAVLEILESAYADVKRSGTTIGTWVIDGTKGVLVYIERNGVNICLTTIIWENTHSFRLAGRLWKRIPYDALTPEALRHAVDDGIEARRAELIACRFCGKLVAPEMISRGACPKCEYERLGIIH